MSETKAEPTPAADRIVADLCNRRGLRQAWEDIDEDIQNEIKSKWERLASAPETKRQRDALLAAGKGVFEGDDPDPEELRPAWRALYDAIHECEQGDAGEGA